MLKLQLIKTPLLTLTILFIVACSHRKPKPPEVLSADYMIKNRLTTNNDSAAIANVMETLLNKTIWKDKLKINKPYDPEMINCYIIDGSLSYIRNDDKLSKSISNCSYAGSNIFIMDVAFLRSFLAKHKIEAYDSNDKILSNQECFLYWTIGHELGHLLGGHLSGHFESGSLDSFVENSDLQNKHELQADSSFVGLIGSDKKLRFSIEMLMISILNAEIEQKVGPIKVMGVLLHYDYTNRQVVKYAQQPTHPEYVIRLSRMLQLSSRMSGDEGLYDLVGSFINTMQQGN